MIEKTSDCVSCETCINCGRKYHYNVLLCDKCKGIIDADDRVYFVDGKDLCMDCALDTLDSKIVGDVLDD